MGLVSIITEEIGQALARRRLEQRLTSAQHHLAQGDPAPMQQIADDSIGDAWLALARFHAQDSSSSQAATLATHAYENAVACEQWLKDSSGLCRSEYDRRRFLGIGRAPDYHALVAQWEATHFRGYERELELAWIYACGPAELKDKQRAWEWLCLSAARWGAQREVQLPSSSIAEIRASLVKTLSVKARTREEERATRIAYDEFVSGK